MNLFYRAILTSIFAVALLTSCNKSDDAVENMKEEVGEAVDATKDAAEAVAEDTKEAITDAAAEATK